MPKIHSRNNLYCRIRVRTYTRGLYVLILIWNLFRKKYIFPITQEASSIDKRIWTYMYIEN